MKLKRTEFCVNGETIYPMSEEEYKEIYKAKIKAYENRWNDMDRAEQLGMIMYACNTYGSQWIRGITEPRSLSDQMWFHDDSRIWENEAMKEYIDDN